MLPPEIMILPISCETSGIWTSLEIKTYRSQSSYPIPKAGAKFPEASML